MSYPSAWLINYKDGSKVILSEEKYREHRKETPIKCVESEEHWFFMSQCIKMNPDVGVIE